MLVNGILPPVLEQLLHLFSKSVVPVQLLTEIQCLLLYNRTNFCLYRV